jgi:predicted enzyme related to lactoylglutathione lyase
MTIQATTVWTEIPVTDIDAAIAFYGKVFKWDLSVDQTGPMPMANFTSDMTVCRGHLYPGAPAKDGHGPTIHLMVPDSLEAATDRLLAAGGQVVMGPVSIPVGRFTKCVDPDGNSIGLFEAKAA